jgi:uncharacterized membrane protein
MTTTSSLSQNARIQSLDILRGLIMVLMAIDHVRVYSGLPAGGPEAGIFFTRWITHFCAPGFAFFAGTSAFLYGIKLQYPQRLATYLLTRGLLLVVLEVTVIRFLWSFHLGTDFILAGVIWMLGWCMIVLALVVRLNPLAIGLAGLVIIVFQSFFSLVPGLVEVSWFSKVWEFVYPSGNDTFEGVSVLYSIMPWAGVMMAGYGFGMILLRDQKKRKMFCLTVGLGSIAVFIALGILQVSRAEDADNTMPFVMRLLSQQKYPASLLFLLMTLGPMIAVVPFLEKAGGWFSRVMTTFGQVPFFYYLMHILVIHLTALAVFQIQTGSTHPEWFAYAPYVYFDPMYHWSLMQLYAVFLLDVVILYFICRWYRDYKLRHPEKAWLKYL